MPQFDKTVPVDQGVMRFPQPRIAWADMLAGMTSDPSVAHLYILDENENFTDERRQVMAVAKGLGFTVRCGQNRVQTPPLDRQFYVVRTA